MAERSYSQFCPVAMAAELLCTRWTILVLRELLAGSTRFNALRRGVPRMSPALLSRRLKELEAAGIVRRVASSEEPGLSEYALTAAGAELAPLVEAFGRWGQRWVRSELSLQRLDASLLMWDMRRHVGLVPAAGRRQVVQFKFPEQPAADRDWWLIADKDDEPDLCLVDPGFDVALYVVTDLRTMTAIWMGAETVREAKAQGRLMLIGDPALAEGMQDWLGLSPFARGEDRDESPAPLQPPPSTISAGPQSPLPGGERVG